MHALSDHSVCPAIGVHLSISNILSFRLGRAAFQADSIPWQAMQSVRMKPRKNVNTHGGPGPGTNKDVAYQTQNTVAEAMATGLLPPAEPLTQNHKPVVNARLEAVQCGFLLLPRLTSQHSMA
jgi:hypothetical protein